MAKRLTEETISKIRKFRQKGLSLNEIKQKISVGYGTIFRYIKEVEILPQYKKLWFGKRGGSIKRKKLAEIEAAKKAKKLINSLSFKEKAIFLSALYWAEGGKRDFNFTNTDPDMIKAFVNGLEQIFNIPRDQIKVSIRIYEDLDRKKCLDYWSQVAGIPKAKFVNVNVLRGKKIGKLDYGMCRVRITKGGNMLKYITALGKRTSELFSTSPNSSTDRTGVS